MKRMTAFWVIFTAILIINLMGPVIKFGVEVFLETILLLALLPLVARFGGGAKEEVRREAGPGRLARLREALNPWTVSKVKIQPSELRWPQDEAPRPKRRGY